MNQRSERRRARQGALLVLAAAFLWGTVGPAQVVAGAPASPVALGAARILLGGIILVTFALAVSGPSVFAPLLRHSWRPLACAAAATGIFQAVYLTSVARAGAALATAVAFGVAPVATGVCAWAVTKRPLTAAWTMGTVSAVAGCTLLLAPGDATGVDLFGIVLGAVAGICFGVYTVAAKRLADAGADMAAAVSVTLLAGGLLISPWLVPAGRGLLDPRGLALVGWLGGITTTVAYMAFVRGLRWVSAATAGTLSLAEPLTTAALAIPLLGERLTPSEAIGSVLLLGGLVIVSVPRPRRPSRREPRRTSRRTPGPKPCRTPPPAARAGRLGTSRLAQTRWTQPPGSERGPHRAPG